jgi:hypothetical protein
VNFSYPPKSIGNPEAANWNGRAAEILGFLSTSPPPNKA